jgi:hypothetical protein
MARDIHPHFQYFLDFKEQPLIDLYTNLRAHILSLFPDSIELLYHTHALTSLHTVSEKMSDGFCMIPIYTNHLNLGFNKGTLLDDPDKLLQGTGKLIRHIPIQKVEDYRNKKVNTLLKLAIDLAISDCTTISKKTGMTISKIKEPT